MSDADEKLRALAKAATTGEWHVVQTASGSNWIDAGKYDEVLAPAPVACMSHCYGGSSQIDLSDEDSAFIAAANPLVVLSLLDRLAAVEAENERLNRRLFPGQGESYANEVERQRAVIDTFQSAVESLRAGRDQALQALQRARELREELLYECDNFAPPDTSFETGYPEIPPDFWSRVRSIQDRLADALAGPVGPDKTHTGGLAMTALEQWREQEAGRLQADAEPDETRCESVIWSAQAPKGFIGDDEHRWSRCGRHIGHDGRHEVAGIFNQTWE